MRILPAAATALALALPTAALPDAHVAGSLAGEIFSTDGAQLGSVSVLQTDSGVIRVVIQAVGIAPGTHGVHLHETGECVGDFSSSGDHISGDANHGLVEGGPHPGDLHNGYVGDDGELSMEAFAIPSLTMEMLTDVDGSALVIHSGADDYVSQPAGDSGSPVACAVLDAVPASEEG